MNADHPSMNAGGVAGLESRSREFSALRLLQWSLLRELWEYRSIYLAPAIAAAIFLFGYLASLFRFPARMRVALAMEPMQRMAELWRPYTFAALLMMGTMLVVAVIYSIDALHGERRDRSILFWKSMPVSDVMAAIAKAAIPIVVLPLTGFVATLAMQWLMLLMSSAALLASGMSPSFLWTQMGWAQSSLMLFFHMMLLHGLWYAPFYGWLLLVSAWARRGVLMWASLPLLLIGGVEKIALNTSRFAELLGHRFSGGSDPFPVHGDMAMHMVPVDQLGAFLARPGLWAGLALTAVFLALAVRLRRDQGPI